jgi:hypothetical protein
MPIIGTVRQIIIFNISNSFHLFQRIFILPVTNSGKENHRGWTKILVNMALGE